jgi:sensor histidine kinase YesM
MNINFLNKNLFILIPLVGILIVGIYMVSHGVTDGGTLIQYAIHGIVFTAGIWLGCVLIVNYLWEKFPWEQSPLIHIILEIIMILTYTVTFSFLLYLLEARYGKNLNSENLGMEIFTTLLITFFITSVHESIFFYMQWKYNFSKSVRLEKENIEARFEALKTQINPHFLFNTLNSLTTMAENNRPVVDYIKNLSELLRYMLKNNEKDLVPLLDEISILNSYISLQQMRFPKSLVIKVEVPENFYNYEVPPLALQMLVENAIKHNIISREKPLKIEIKAWKESISVSNNLQRKEGVDSTGQGLNNITQRYRFFTTRIPEIIETNDIFTVTIPLLEVEI